MGYDLTKATAAASSGCYDLTKAAQMPKEGSSGFGLTAVRQSPGAAGGLALKKVTARPGKGGAKKPSPKKRGY